MSSNYPKNKHLSLQVFEVNEKGNRIRDYPFVMFYCQQDSAEILKMMDDLYYNRIELNLKVENLDDKNKSKVIVMTPVEIGSVIEELKPLLLEGK